MLALLLAALAPAAEPPDDAVMVSMPAVDAGIVAIDETGRLTEIVQGAPAWQAGLRPGQVLVRAGGAKVAGMDPRELRGRTSGQEGDTVALLVERDGARQTVQVQLTPYDRANATLVGVNGELEVSLWCEAGDCEDGDGRATDGSERIVAGPFREGRLQGYGVERDQGGVRYDGGFEQGMRHGPGALTDASGTRYAGTWQHGVADGSFTVLWKDQGTYEGQVRALLPHGQGQREWDDGRRYIGAFEYGDFDGQGDLLLPSGEHYVGAFQNNVAHGQGVLDLPRGDHLEGTFYKGRLHGQGMRRWADNGRVYRGAFHLNQPHGQGQLTWTDGEVHVGSFDEGEISGLGVRFLSSTRRVVGHWYDERRALGWVVNDKDEILYEGFIVQGLAEGWGRKVVDGEPRKNRMWFNNKVRGEHPRSVDQGRQEKAEFDAFEWSQLDALMQVRPSE